MRNSDRLKLEVRRSAQPFAMLMFLLVCGGIVVGIIFKNLTFERPWQGYNEVKAEFTDVKGVFPGGHQVRINGVKVGIVKKAELEDGRAVLTLSIEDKWGDVYKNAKMRIRPVTPLQDLYVNIVDRGDPSAGVAGRDDVIPAGRTETPVDVSRVLNTFNADTRQRMTILLTELGKGLEDGGVKLRATFNELAPFLRTAERGFRELSERRTNVKRIVTNAGELSAALAKRDDDLNRLVTRGNQALGELASNDRALAGTLTGISDLLPVARSSFADVRSLTGELDPALRGLRPVTSELASGLQGLQQFGRDAEPALRTVRPALGDLRSMARVLSPAASSLQSALGKLETQTGDFDTITKFAVPCFEQNKLQDFFQNSLSVLKFFDPNQNAYPRAETTVDTDTFTLGKTQGVNTRRLPSCTSDAEGK